MIDLAEIESKSEEKEPDRRAAYTVCTGPVGERKNIIVDDFGPVHFASVGDAYTAFDALGAPEGAHVYVGWVDATARLVNRKGEVV